MSQHDEDTIAKWIGTLKWIVGLGWCLLAGAFALGVWVATLEIRQAAVSSRLIDHEVSIKNHGSELNGIHINEARASTDLAYIKSTLERIEKKLP